MRQKAQTSPISSPSSPSSASTLSRIGEILEAHLPTLKPFEDLYQQLHSNPELSTQEASTASLINESIRSIAGSPYAVHGSIGGHGVAASLRNGAGPTVLLRADMDALPVLERTGLSYASHAMQVDSRDGECKPTMHACGHDMHCAMLLGAAGALASSRAAWSGTLVLVFQPAEERAGGARAMVEDGLFGIVPEPDVVLGQHVGPSRAGTVGVRPGALMAGAESLDVRFLGKGGHGSAPELCIDPVAMAAGAVVKMQGIVGKEVKTGAETGVVTVGFVQAGTSENVIPDEARIKVNMRSFEADTLQRIVASARRIVKAENEAANAKRPPSIEVISRFPVQENDADATRVVSRVFTELFGDAFNPEEPKVMASEDFSILATSIGKPCVFWFLGATDQEQWDKAKQEGKLDDLPINHSPFFAPTIEPTLQIGVKALCAAALAFLTLK